MPDDLSTAYSGGAGGGKRGGFRTVNASHTYSFDSRYSGLARII